MKTIIILLLVLAMLPCEAFDVKTGRFVPPWAKAQKPKECKNNMGVSKRDELIHRLRNGRGPFQTAFRTLPNGLLAYYAFEERFDEEMHAESSVPPNANPLGRSAFYPGLQRVTSATGKIGRGAHFVFDSVDVHALSHDSNATFLFNSDRSLTFWIRFDGFNDHNSILWKGLPFGGSEYSLHVDGVTRKLVVNEGITHSRVLEALTWYFVAITYKRAGHAWNIKINNESPTTGTNSVIASAGPFAIGGDSAFDGVIDELGIWDRMLTFDEQTVLYNQGCGLTYADLVKVIPCKSITCCDNDGMPPPLDR